MNSSDLKTRDFTSRAPQIDDESLKAAWTSLFVPVDVSAAPTPAKEGEVEPVKV